ncbi:C10 family peptidase [uncultured Alistipes sp.]|uniref:C10 family peptidase n=1 Tax=uncultured Alistipes sp. TaxID=538949 RepID=UPI002601C665|nr:C10 family peptidase [uncultured Alistipes sp.]
MKKFLKLLSLFILISCSHEDVVINDDYVPEKNEHHISLETALSELNAVLTDIDATTRAEGIRSVRSVSTIRNVDLFPETRSHSAQEEDIVYIINFDEDQGFALLAANDRLAPVIAITEHGNLTPEDFKTCAKNNTQDPNFPVILPEVISYISGASFDGPILPPPLPTAYAIYGDWIFESQKGPYVQFKWNQSPPYNYYSPEVSGLDSYMNGKGYVGCTAVAAGQLIAANSHRGLFLLPASLGGYTLDRNMIWQSIDLLKSRGRGDMTFTLFEQCEEALAVALFLRAIGKSIGMTYKVSGSSAPSRNVASLMNSIGYRNAELVDYKENSVCQMLNRQCPVYMEGKGYDSKKKEYLYHAWLIDGVYTQRRFVETRSTLTNELLGSEWESRNLFHCNFGYSGRYDGYYTPRVYDFHAGALMQDPMIDREKPDTTSQNYGYTHDFKIITHSYAL